MTNLSELLNSKKTVFIGSSPENDIVLNDPHVSPIHCQVSKVKNGVYMIVDLDSAAGTFINDQKITKAFAGTTDSIRVGNQMLQLGGEPEEQTLTKSEPAATVQASSSAMGITASQNNPAVAATAATETASTVRHFPPKGSTEKKEILVYFLAAPEDEATCEAIYKHLSTIRFSSPMPVEMMGDFRITGGEEIASYRQKIADADIVLAFISVDFLNNNDCYEHLKTVIDNHNRGKAILLPILVRNCMWKATPFANLPLLPKNHQPLNNKQFWNSEDDALTNVADDIYESISHLTQHSTPEEPLKVANTTTLKTNWRASYLWTNFWKRTVAYMLDVLILILPVIVVLFLVFGDGFMSDAGEIPVQYGVIYTALLILVFSYFDSSKWRGSPGKHIMKLQITDDAGNPISFSKAAVRNTIKFILFGFVGTLQNSGDITLLIMAAQIICFVTTRKFIHDYLSHTVIGERLKTAAVPIGSSNGDEAAQSVPVVAKKSSTRLAAMTAGIVAVIGFGLFLAIKYSANETPQQPQPAVDPGVTVSKSHQLSEEEKASLITAVKYANETEAEALQRLDASILYRAFTGEKLRQSLTEINRLNEQQIYQVATLENQEFHDFRLSPDGQKAEVETSETWNAVYYAFDTNLCQGKIPSTTLRQTIYLEKTGSVWMVYNIVFDSNAQPQVQPCN